MTVDDAERGALPPGFDLFEYRIERVLGRGGFGITYKATDRNLERPVAIKEYMPRALAGRRRGTEVRARGSARGAFARGLQRFLREARTVGRFDHPAIVPVVRFFEANGTAYMVMAYQEGESLGQILETAGTLGEAALDELLRPLLDGLGTVHAAGVLHRDIKPDNIFVRLADGAPMLLDFGAARQATGAGRRVTRIVTPGYAPCEQYSTDGRLGPWTDIYALAAVLYDGVAGAPPVEAPDRAAGTAMIPAAEAGRGRYRQAFLDAIDHALAVHPRDRPQSIADWHATLPPPLSAGRRDPERPSLLPPPAATLPVTRIVMPPTVTRPVTPQTVTRPVTLPTIRRTAAVRTAPLERIPVERIPESQAPPHAGLPVPVRPSPPETAPPREPGPLCWVAATLVVIMMAAAAGLGFGLGGGPGAPAGSTARTAPGTDLSGLPAAPGEEGGGSDGGVPRADGPTVHEGARR